MITREILDRAEKCVNIIKLKNSNINDVTGFIYDSFYIFEIYIEDKLSFIVKTKHL